MKVGDIVRTPYEPTGIVQILEISEPKHYIRESLVTVRYLHDHYGYAAGTEGLYPLHMMKPLGNIEERELTWMMTAFLQSHKLLESIAKVLAFYAMEKVKQDDQP